MLGLLFCLLMDVEPAPAIKVLARGPYSHPDYGVEPGKVKGLVLRNAGDLVFNTAHAFRSVGLDRTGPDASRELAVSLKVKEIDWSKQMAVAVLAGKRPSSAFKVDITGLRIEKGVLKVSWKLHKDARGGDDVITYPSQCLLIPRHSGKVVFDPPLGGAEPR